MVLKEDLSHKGEGLESKYGTYVQGTVGRSFGSSSWKLEMFCLRFFFDWCVQHFMW